jgi:hypothetical protein
MLFQYALQHDIKNVDFVNFSKSGKLLFKPSLPEGI